MGFGKKTTVVLAVVVVVGVAALILGLEHAYGDRDHKEQSPGSVQPPLSNKGNETRREKRRAIWAVVKQHTKGPSPRCGARLTLPYVRDSTTSFTFDLCQAIDCGGYNSFYKNTDVYICDDYQKVEDCERSASGQVKGSLCNSWYDAGWTTGGWKPWARLTDKRDWWVQQDEWEILSIQRDYSSDPTKNPITLSVNRAIGSRNGQDVWMLAIGVWIAGSDQITPLQINILDPLTHTQNDTDMAETTVKPPLKEEDVIVQDFSKMRVEDVLELSAGAGQDNLWIRWLIQNAKEQHMEGCVACATARPVMFTNPAPLFPNEDPAGYACMLNFTHSKTASRNCTTLASLFPPGFEKPGYFTAIKGEGARYHCFNLTGSSKPTIKLGDIPPDWCNTTVQNKTALGPVARIGLFYYCGGLRLYSQIKFPNQTSGVCAMVRLAMPISLVGSRVHYTHHKAVQLTVKRRRRARSMQGPAFDPWAGTPTYIDSIGVPRGVPNEYKLADQIAAGFENIPLLSAIFPVTPSKNVDRINFVHYNVLRLSNATRDAIEGLAEQTAPTSLMALQNRMALDMLLAEKGGVCSMFGEMCCTVIPNNTAPDGKVTRALNQLRALSQEMHDASGVSNPLEGWMTTFFGKWKNLITACLTSIAVFLAILVTCGCCCVPCLRTMTSRLITTALSKEKAPPPYSAGMLPLLTMPEDGEDVEALQLV